MSKSWSTSRYRSWLLATVLLGTVLAGGPAVAASDRTGSAAPTPSPATGVTAVVDESQVGVRVTWSPGDGGGSPITRYTVQASNGIQVEVGPTATSATLTGMPRLQPYYFYVTVWNEAGGYAVSEKAGPVTLPSGLPSPPTAVTAVGGEESATVTWTGASGNGAAITGFIVLASTGSRWVTSDPATSIALTDLDGGRAVSFTVQTISGRGISPESSPPSPTITPTAAPDDDMSPGTGGSGSGSGSGSEATAPTRPARPRVRVVGHKVVLRWEAPRSTTGPILRYRVRLGTVSTKVILGSSTRLVFKRVPAGVHKATVSARNRAGWSKASRATRIVVR